VNGKANPVIESGDYVGGLEKSAGESCAHRPLRRVVSRTRWQLATFYGKSGGESVGVVDLLGGVISVLAVVGVLRPVFAEGVPTNPSL
jgi:hypothetical protein